ncbi:SH3 domain-containing lethal (3) 05822 isoform 2-T2 [Aphomia sociella]
MKGPGRPAPAIPGVTVNRYSPVTNWNDDPFAADVFEPTPQFGQKKKPPPRPPPPKINIKQPDIATKPSHFIRKPTVLTSLMSRKKNGSVTNPSFNLVGNQQDILSNDVTYEIETNKMFPKCEPKNVQTASLIDFSSPPSSPTFTTRSSSDGLSVDSFGSDATTSTNHHNTNNGGNASQAESGFEDDFDLILHSRKTMAKDDTLDDFSSVDPFSPVPALNKPPIMKKPVLSKDLYNISSKDYSQPTPLLKGPTIIRAKPVRPKPPDNSALLKNTFRSSFPVTPMNVNTTMPIQKINNAFGDNSITKPIGWNVERSLDRESSPPMPSVPPPPPPAVVDEDLPVEWPEDVPDFVANVNYADEDDEPYAVALFDYFTDHPDDLCFSMNSRIKLIRRVDNEWLYGRLRSGVEGLFPSNYVEIKVPLPNEKPPQSPRIGVATAMYDFEPVQPGDLRFQTGDTIYVTQKLSEEWYVGECNGMKGQFPVNYVQMS